MARDNLIFGTNVAWRAIGQTYVGRGRLSGAEYVVRPHVEDGYMRWILGVRQGTSYRKPEATGTLQLGSFPNSGKAMLAADRVEMHPPEATLENPVGAKNVALLAAAGAAVGGLLYFLTRPKATSLLHPDSRVALIGDSLSVGLGPELAKMAAAENIPFKWEGHGGTNTRQWATHAAACGQCGDWMTDFRPTISIVVLGTNDGSAPDVTNYQTIRDGIRSLGSQVVWVEPNTMTKSSLAAARKIIESLGVPVVPEVQVPINQDGVHPTSLGYYVWAQKIWKYLKGS